jgi:hypothetical protein
MIQDWGLATTQALQGAWQGFLNFIPDLIAAIIVFVIGWFVACGIGKLISELLVRLKFNRIFERGGWKDALEKAEFKVNPSEFIGAICKWILVVVFLMIAADILKWTGFVLLLQKIISWLPNLVIAIAIFIVAIVVADILEKIIKAAVKKIGVSYVNFLGAAARWGIYIFAGLIILRQLGVTPTIIDTFVIGLVGMVALALGLAFGLGGKDAAAKLIQEAKQKISEK